MIYFKQKLRRFGKNQVRSEKSESVIEVNKLTFNTKNADAGGKITDFPYGPAGDELVARPLQSRQGKGRRKWLDIALWIFIIVSWCGFAVLALTVR
jgi:hypothetical protein